MYPLLLNEPKKDKTRAYLNLYTHYFPKKITYRGPIKGNIWTRHTHMQVVRRCQTTPWAVVDVTCDL